MARKILTKVDFCGIESENFAIETYVGTAPKTDQGSLYIDGKSYPNKVHYVAFDNVGINGTALANFTVASEKWANDTFGSALTWVSTNGSNVVNHLSNTTVHITDNERTTWNAKQDNISDLDDIRDNASTAYGWGNHASAGYDKLAIFEELKDVGVVNTVSTAPRGGIASVADKELVFSSNKGFLWFSAKNKAFYNVDKDTAYSGETMSTLHQYGKLIAAGQNIYKFNGSEWSAGVAWNLVYKGADIANVKSIEKRLETVETFFGAANTDKTLNRWAELARFLDNYSDDKSMTSILSKKVEGNAAITAFTADDDGFKFPLWDTKGLVTGAKGTAYSKSISINNTAYNIYAAGNGSLPKIFAPTTGGTEGQFLVSAGKTKTPTWQTVYAITSTGTEGQVLVPDSNGLPTWGVVPKTIFLTDVDTNTVVWGASKKSFRIKVSGFQMRAVKLYMITRMATTDGTLGSIKQIEEVVADVNYAIDDKDSNWYLVVNFAKTQTSSFMIEIG